MRLGNGRDRGSARCEVCLGRHRSAGLRDQLGGVIEVLDADQLVRRMHVAIRDSDYSRRNPFAGDMNRVSIGTRLASRRVQRKWDLFVLSGLAKEIEDDR